MNRNSFRCFAIFKSGVADNNGEFLLVHKRGCKKTFASSEAKLKEKLTAYNYESNNQFANNKQFDDNNWYGIKDEKNEQEGIWFIMLCFPNCNKQKVYDSLQQISTYYQKRSYFKLSKAELLSAYEVEKIIWSLEEEYGNQDGQMTDQDEKDVQKKMAPQSSQKQQLEQFNPPTLQQTQKIKQQIDLRNISERVQSLTKPLSQVQKYENNVIHNVKAPAQQLIKQEAVTTERAAQKGSKEISEVKIKQVVKREKLSFDPQNAKNEMRMAGEQKTSDSYIFSLIIITLIGAAISGAYVFFTEP